MSLLYLSCLYFFFFNDTATTEIYTLSLHDALPISSALARALLPQVATCRATPSRWRRRDRKSTRLNSSHMSISYAVFCLKKKNMTDSGFPITHTDAWKSRKQWSVLPKSQESTAPHV